MPELRSRERLGLTRALLRALWTRQGHEQLANGGAERMLRNAGLEPNGFTDAASVVTIPPVVTEEMILAGHGALDKDELIDGYVSDETLKAVYVAMAYRDP